MPQDSIHEYRGAEPRFNDAADSSWLTGRTAWALRRSKSKPILVPLYASHSPLDASPHSISVHAVDINATDGPFRITRGGVSYDLAVEGVGWQMVERELSEPRPSAQILGFIHTLCTRMPALMDVIA